MPQPKRQSARSRSTTKAKGSSKAKSSTKRSSSAKRSSATKRSKRSTPKRSGAARRSSPATRRDATRPVQQVVEVLGRGVVVTRDRLQESLDDAVKRGRMTRDDANDLLIEILKRGRKQTEDVLADIEQLLGRSRGQLGTARRRAEGAGRNVGGKAADRALREVDRVRRASGVAGFPILNYDDLNAAQVADRLSDLTPAQLRKVRDYERRNANRKSVLDAIERALG
jgi:polyhydroxyalkanoate synthesis regulator phasin